MTATQSGYRVHRWGDEPTWGTFEVTEPGPGEVAVDVEACGVGLTVLNLIRNTSNDAALLPRVPGHEFVGRISEVGPGGNTGLIGRRVVAYFYLICGVCAACRAGREPRCDRLAGLIGVQRDGGYAPTAVIPEINAIPVDDDLDPVSATVAPDAVATPVHVADRAGIAASDRVAVIGAGGGVGIHMIQVARLKGAAVVGLDISDEKLTAIEALQVQAARSDDFNDVEYGLFDGARPTVVVDFVGTARSAAWALASLSVGGRFVTMTSFSGRIAEFESHELVERELSILGSRYSHRRQVSEAARLVATGEVEAIIGSVVGPREVLEVHDALTHQQLIGRGAIDWRLPS